MRVIEQQMVEAVRAHRNFSLSNTQVVVNADNSLAVYLHGNCICKVQNGIPSFSNAGWGSNTTKSRLNALLGVFGYQPIHQKDFVWYWDSRLSVVSKYTCGWSTVEWYS